MSDSESKDEVDVPNQHHHPSAGTHGVLVSDRGTIRFSSHGGLPPHEAYRLFWEWDRVTGADAHPVYALGVTMYTPHFFYEVGDSTEAIAHLVEDALVWAQRERRALLDQVTSLQRSQSEQLRLARAAAFETCAKACSDIADAHRDAATGELPWAHLEKYFGVGADRCAAKIRDLASHPSVGAASAREGESP
jgi:hypothetical protein